ncbi:MAG: endolytic transglycosylase MltG [Chloroflexota bacterium]|nr:endolytic transglycosylase MltG [Chloroflexota bacterium]
MAAIVAAFAVALTAGLAWFVMQTPGAVFSDENEHRIPPFQSSGGTTLIIVTQGESAKAIGDNLQQKGVVRSAKLFEVLVGVTGVQNSLEAGDYEFDAGLPAIEVVKRIAEGKTASRDVLIPEGRRIEEVADLLEKAGVIGKQEFLTAAKQQYSEPVLQQTQLASLEGFLFPATYAFNRNEKPAVVVDRMLQAFQDQVANKVQFEGQDLTLDQAITLASIVEREAVNPAERPMIASVFLNRLRIGIPLQADPTVQYAVAQSAASVAQYGYWKTELTVDDLKIDSPYNTYVHPGLPPGPIASPGLASIEAVVRPASTNFLFFVAKNDGTGSHAFAETLEEHLRNVEKYQQ